ALRPPAPDGTGTRLAPGGRRGLLGKGSGGPYEVGGAPPAVSARPPVTVGPPVPTTRLPPPPPPAPRPAPSPTTTTAPAPGR
ncbi:MAG: hypothetical protein M3404_10660, partial [Actinomycetota bacterium]|nr:hypothetical protein [Actinomycetota bacterium]